MDDHPIETLMNTAMGNIKKMVDVNTIVGDAVETKDGSVIIPISKVNFGFAAGGGEYSSKENKKNSSEEPKFSGGSGAGVMLQPMAFLVVKENQVRLLPVNDNAVIERLINIAPELIEQIKGFSKKDNNGEMRNRGF
ncbi:GerW family sporulation protein [Natroniella acetigena]|uniref:GerW family sporulation protein n=1 Tax=Natroniella acetigena TaxID=52004 RepID=UPI002009DC12|nr:GerW family sporulation protein [Natroniella acetigena]MCK8827102.1 GerW family sporulation protein [Natroniella acetigena]